MKNFITLFLIVLSLKGFGQERDSLKPHSSESEVVNTADGEKIIYSLNTPFSTIFTHLKYLQSDSYYPQVAAKTFNVDEESEAEDLALKLKQILDGKGLYVDMDVIPKQPDYRDSLTNLNRYVLFPDIPEIYVEKTGDKWFYSKRTVQAIPVLYHKVYPLGSDWLINLMPKVGHHLFLGLELWQYLGILLLLLIALVLHAIFTAIIRFAINRFAIRIKLPEFHITLFEGVAKALSLMLLSIILITLLPVLQLPVQSGKYAVTFLSVLTPFFAMLAAYRAVDILCWFLEKRAMETAGTMDDQLVPMVRKLSKIIVVAGGVLFILNTLNFNIMALLAGISIGGLAVALAAQDTIKNLFGSLMIFVDRPFQIGDGVKFNGVAGQIEEVGFRSTRIRTFENSLVYVPNGELANAVIDNIGLRIYRRFRTMIALTYDTPPDLIEEFVEGLREIVRNHPKTNKENFEIHLNEMGAASLDIIVNVFFEVPTWTEELKARHEIILAALRLAEELGVRFAFPTQTIHIEEFPEKKSTTPDYDTNRDNARKKISEFLVRYKQGLKHYEENQPGQN